MDPNELRRIADRLSAIADNLSDDHIGFLDRMTIEESVIALHCSAGKLAALDTYAMPQYLTITQLDAALAKSRN
jgi:hypothetical protein